MQMFSLLVTACLTAIAPTAPAAPSVDAVIARNLDTPWGLAFLPDGTALVSERDSGKILRVRPGHQPRVHTVGRIKKVAAGGEGGLLGLAVQPGDTPRWIYAYYTSATDNRIVRMRWNGRDLGKRDVLVSGIPRGSNHDGGRLAFGPDGMLYASTGDAGRSELAQRRSSLAGKVLRMTPKGNRPSDNPFPHSLVWTLGHRNVEGLAFDSAGRLIATEFGESNVDELNVLVRGKNYGWPIHEGPANDPRFVNPIAWWSPTSTASPSGVAVRGDFAFVAMLQGQDVVRIRLSGAKVGAKHRLNLGDLGRLRTIATAPDGALWLTTSNTDGRGNVRPGDDKILRLN